MLTMKPVLCLSIVISPHELNSASTEDHTFLKVSLAPCTLTVTVELKWKGKRRDFKFFHIKRKLIVGQANWFGVDIMAHGKAVLGGTGGTVRE
jgi:hypothetical protein